MIKLKVNNVRGYSGFVTVKTDENRVPLEKFWRDRLKDAKTDGCVEVVNEPKKLNTKSQEKVK